MLDKKIFHNIRVVEVLSVTIVFLLLLLLHQTKFPLIGDDMIFKEEHKMRSLFEFLKSLF